MGAYNNCAPLSFNINIMAEKINNIQLEVSPEAAKGTYSNLAVISHAPTEIVLDFAQMFPGHEGAVVRDRIIMSPFHAKQLLMALTDNIQKYEKQFGTIPVPGKKKPEGGDVVPFDILGKA